MDARRARSRQGEQMQTVATWQTIELELESDRDRVAPYLEVEATAVFVGPDDRVIRRPAFWDGGRTWRVRFAPTCVGEWAYHVACCDPTDSGLHGVTGTLNALDPEGEHGVYRHGFLKAGTGHLAHDDDTPFFWLGDTHWRFAWERWDAANKAGWDSQFRGMVDRRVQQGFTVYQSNLISYDDPSQPSPCWQAGIGPRCIDVNYFQTVIDPRMAYIAASGLVNAFGLAWYEAMDRPEATADLVRLARYVVARYGSLPMAWTLGGEVAGYDPARRQSRINGWRAVGRTITELDDYAHPRSAHLTNERPLADYYQTEEWPTFTLNQLGHGDHDLSPTHYKTLRDKSPGRPLIEGESLYEGLTSVESAGRRTVSDTMVRQVAYRAIQAGCCGYTYGAQGCWNNAWDQGDAATEWGDLPWFDGVDLPGATQVGHLRRFYESIPWADLNPDTECFVTDHIINAAFNPPSVTANSSRSVIVLYFGETYRISDESASLTLLNAGPYRLRWFDPRRGVFIDAGTGLVPIAGVLPIPNKPDDADWVLLAETPSPL